MTQQLRYSIYGIFDLAYHGDEKPIRIEEIGRRQDIPPRYLEQIFQRLRRAGLVVSKRGPGGGYLLARSPDEITLADVVTAVQGAVLRGGEDSPRTSGSRTDSKTDSKNGPGPAGRAGAGAANGQVNGASSPSAHTPTREPTHVPRDGESAAFVLELLEQRIATALRSITVANLCQEGTRRGLLRTAAAPLMYEI